MLEFHRICWCDFPIEVDLSGQLLSPKRLFCVDFGRTASVRRARIHGLAISVGRIIRVIRETEADKQYPSVGSVGV